MRLLRRLMSLFRGPAASPADPQLLATRRRLDAAESRLARKLGVSVEQIRADYQRGDHALAGR